jgi:AcrR family transcriptional regulator
VKVFLQPRKLPVQARSNASVQAILEATIQVLLTAGRVRLTTAKVASRAGVSVGTLYQYFPNKSALLQAALKRHMDEVAVAVERTCRQQRGNTPRQMAAALITAFFEAKMKNPKASVALYSISSDLDGASVIKETSARANAAIFAMLETASEPINTDLQVVCDVLQGAMAGISRRLLEGPAAEQRRESLQRELIRMASSYLSSCSAHHPSSPKSAPRDL